MWYTDREGWAALARRIMEQVRVANSESLAHVSDNRTLCPTCRRDKYSCSALAELGAIRIPCSVPDQNLF